MVLIPERDELWFGLVGKGAWYENQEGVKKEACFSNRREISKLINVEII